jgi:hypothetical protein
MEYLPTPYRPQPGPPPPPPPPTVHVVFSPSMTNKQEQVGITAIIAAVLLGLVGGYVLRDRERGPPR